MSVWFGIAVASLAAAAYFFCKLIFDLVAAAAWLVVGILEFLISPFRKRRH